MFCRNCGAQLTATFCTRCGAPAVQPPLPVQPAAPQPYSQPQPPASKTGSGLKVLFVVLGVMVFLGVLLAGTIWYGWHKVKQTVASQGIDLNTAVDRGAGRQLDACELLTKEDLAQILSLPIERSEGTGRSTHSTCRYYSSAAQQRGTDEAAAAFKKLQQNTKSNDSPAQQDEALKNLETMVRSVGGAAAGTVNDSVLNIEVESENAKAAMAGFRLGAGLAAAVVGADAKPEARKAFREDVQGIGDEAVFGPLQSLLMFRKGDVSVQIDARTLPGGRDTEIAIAQRIAAKL
jgi:hypothetical protein